MQQGLVWILSMLFSGLIVASMACLAQTPPAYRAGSLTKQEPQSIYAADPQDAWNRIFYLLFTRTVKLRLADNFKEGTPFVPIRIGTPLSQTASARTFERIESGDRAIDPLYPSFFQFRRRRVGVDRSSVSAIQKCITGCAQRASTAPGAPPHSDAG